MSAITLRLRARDHEAFETAVSEAVEQRLASALFAEDESLWGETAAAEAARRLGWTNAPARSRASIAQIEQLRDDLSGEGVDRVVLCGMGGSSLAPEVIARTHGLDLVVLDSSHPDMVRAAMIELSRTVVVVSSKSGGTVETDSQRRAFEQAFVDAGIDPAHRIVVVTDPGSPLDELAAERGHRVFHADPTVGGRYSALTAFGLAPSGLAGAPLSQLVDDADAARARLAADDVDNPALRLGVLLGLAARDGADKLVTCDASGAGFGDWAEQLVAESTGKQGLGILPVVVPRIAAPDFTEPTGDSMLVVIGDDTAPEAAWSAAVDGPLGAQFLLWETAVAIAGRIIGINPFDQPDVESAKQAARASLADRGGAADGPDAVDGDIGIFGSAAATADEALQELFDQLTSVGYLSVQAYLDRWEHADLADVRDTLSARLRRPVTFGWGPRFLHSTGQYHKGGPPRGVFLQITDEPRRDLAVPGRDFTFGEFIASQAAGDASVLRDHGRPVLRLHLTDAAAVERLRSVLA